jgi:predicted amidohydrolase YtcJ
VHAIGDEAVALALDGFDAVECVGSIEHAQLVRAEDMSRFAELEVTASVQPAHLLDDRAVAERLWPGRTSQAFALRQMLEAGADVRFGSDAPVSVLDPWLAIAAAVHRAAADDEPWHAGEQLTAEEAIRASVRSTLAVGQPADFAVLDADPFDVSPAELAALPVSATFLGGRTTHSLL